MHTLELTGRLISLGNMTEDDWRSLSSEVPRATIELPGGRVLLIAGLTPGECRGLANCFGERVSVTLTEAAHD